MSTLTLPVAVAHTELAPEPSPQEHAKPQTLVAVQVLFALTIFGAPLAFGAVEPWGWVAIVLLTVVMLGLWAAVWMRRGSIVLVWSPLYVPGGLFLLLGVFQFLTHRTADQVSTRNSLIELAAILVFFFLALQLAADASAKTWQNLGLAVIGYTFGMALFGVLQYFSSPGKLYWSVTPRWHGWIFGPYLNHDHYAGLMEMLIALSAAYLLSCLQRRRAAVLLAFAVLFPVASVLLSGSRGGMVALLLEAAALVGILLRKAPGSRARQAALWVAAALAVAFTAFLWMDNGDVAEHLETVFEPSHASDVSWTYRVQTARDSLRMFRDHRWLGTGLGSFEYAFPRYQSLAGDDVWDHAHDDYVETLAETGLAGGALILTAMVLWFRLAFRNLDERLGHGPGWIQLGAALGCCGLLFHSFFDFNLHVPANALWFAVCAALATAETPGWRRRAA